MAPKLCILIGPLTHSLLSYFFSLSVVCLRTSLSLSLADPDINIADLDIPVNAVATALKDFFMKRLPPIFPPDCMEEIASLSRQYTDTGVLADMRTFLVRLPNANYQIIHFMIAHFAK